MPFGRKQFGRPVDQYTVWHMEVSDKRRVDQISVGQMSVGDSIGQTVFDQKSWNQPIDVNFMTLNIWLSGAPL